jgi:Ca-activated chloride channel family protein
LGPGQRVVFARGLAAVQGGPGPARPLGAGARRGRGTSAIFFEEKAMRERSTGHKSMGWSLAYGLGLVVAGACLLPWATPEALGQAAKVIELEFIYGSEKEDWINEVTADFNAKRFTLDSGEVIQVKHVPLGSGESVYDILEGRRQPHMVSPASAAYIELVNADAKAKKQEMVVDPAQTKNLVLSPVVIAMWKPMAEAMGWPKRAIGWKDIHDLAKDPRGWALYKRPDWGRFRFGHTHPEHSNSGLISVLAAVYAAAGADKREDLTLAEVARAGTYLENLERAVVHYGRSTGFFGKRMYANDIQYLNAAILYENMVVESYLPKNRGGRAHDLVAIYPKEGTFWSDHPVGLVNRPWVTAKHQAAGKKYIAWLLEEDQQRKAMKTGFRPGLERVKLRAPLNKAHGVDPEAKFPIMEVPSAEVMKAIIQLWRKHKKSSRIVLVMDTSASMNQGQKLLNAQKGARALLDLLTERDTVSLMTFNDDFAWVAKDKRLTAANKAALVKVIDTLGARGETALYDATAQAFDHLGRPDPERISAIVVLTDGEDNKSRLTLADLLKKVKFDPEKQPTRIFTICYGRRGKLSAEEVRLQKVLDLISEATKAKSYVGDPKTVRQVLIDIATFF